MANTSRISIALMGLLSLLLAACGGGGGSGQGAESGSGGGPGVPGGGAVVLPPSINVVSLEAPPLSIVSLELQNGVLDDNWSVEIDLSGTGTFHSGSLLTLPALRGLADIQFSAPVMGLVADAQLGSGNTFSVRLRRLPAGPVTNTLTFSQPPVAPPAGFVGVSNLVLQTVLKASLVQSGTPELQSLASAINLAPMYVETVFANYGDNPTLFAWGDLIASAAIEAIYGSAAEASLVMYAHADPMLQGLDGPAGVAGPVASPGTQAREAIGRITACIVKEIENFPAVLSTSFNPIDCFDMSLREIRDNYIPAFPAANRSFALTSVTLTSLAGPLTARSAGPWARRMLDHSQLSENAALFAGATLRLPAFGGTSGDASDFVFGQLTNSAKRRVYNHLSAGFGQIESNIAELLGVPDTFSFGVNEVGSAAFQVLVAAENRLHGAIRFAEDLRERPGSFGGQGPDFAPPSVGLPGMTGGDDGLEVPANMNSPAEFCAYVESLGGAVDFFGLTCQQYMEPWFDRDFFHSVLSPLMDAMPSLEACAGAILSPACDAAIAEFSVFLDRLVAAIHGYTSGNFDCDAGYAGFDTGKGARTCIFAALIEPLCLPGSRPSPFDTGSASTCVYYSRDFVRNGQCRPNYALVDFLGAQRCRWATLPLNLPAAVAVNVSTGERTVLER